MKNAFSLWSELRIFLAVVREGSTLAASKGLGIAQPTVARRIEALEHALGLVLFEKDTRGFRTTAAGRALVGPAEAMEAAAETLCATACGLTALRPIRITAVSPNFSRLAMEIFAEFSARHPEITFEFLPGMRPFDLMAGEADIGLRIVHTAPHPELICRKISTARFALYGSRRYADRHGLPASVSELPAHRFVSFRHPDVTPWLHNWLLEHVGASQIVQSFADLAVMHATVASGSALGIVNVRLAAAEPAFVQCLPPIEALDSPHLMLIAPEAWRREEVRVFTKFFAPRYAAIFR